MPFMITWPFSEAAVAERFSDAVPEGWRMRAKPAPRTLETPKRGCATEMLDPLRSTRIAIPSRTRHAITRGTMGFSVSFPNPAMTAAAWRDPDGPEAGALRLLTPTSTRRSAHWESAHFRQ